MDTSAITSAFVALKTAKDIAESMVTLRDSAAFQSKLLEFQSKLIDANSAVFSAQDERSTLLERIRQLEKQVTDFEAWETEKQRYELKPVSDIGSTAYVLKPETQGTDAPHCICTGCYQQAKKGVLQPTHVEHMRRRNWQCVVCKSNTVVDLPLPGYN